ncbi:MAG: alpha/beta fold hydrolase [Prolixibacteraceae bacterium]|nr:alpha/beta fold hydrolase [Prolixibacteraceae bacterium]
MKNIAVLLVLVISTIGLKGQEITGQWNGALKVQGMQLRIVFNITGNDKGYSSTMDSPDQGAKGIPVTMTTFTDSRLKLEIPTMRIEYNGELKENVITGTFKQNGMEFPMNLSKEKIEKQVVKRSQNPVQPYPYYSEEVTFPNAKAGITLAGTLTMPAKEGKFPAVILITGSGPQNRDEELMGHKPFLVVSDYLTRQGISVLRYDDRGVGQSKGIFKTATTVDFASDVESAIAYLKGRKEIDPKKIGLVGHSEGGIIAPMVSARNKDVSFIVLLAGTGIRGDKLLLLQQELVAKAAGVAETEIQKSREINTKAFEIVIKSVDAEPLKADLRKFLAESMKNSPDYAKPKGVTDEDFLSLQVNQITSPWMLYFIKYDPAIALEKVKCPVLAVNGDKDLQVPSKVNLPAIEKALKKGGNRQVTTIEFPGLNHLFQECKTGSPTEYAEIDQTFSPVALDAVTKWILLKTK